MKDVYEIHKYQNDDFQYVVARTNKHSKEKVEDDIIKMNAMLSDELKSQGIKYILAIGTMTDYMKNVARSKHQRRKSTYESNIFM